MGKFVIPELIYNQQEIIGDKIEDYELDKPLKLKHNKLSKRLRKGKKLFRA